MKWLWIAIIGMGWAINARAQWVVRPSGFAIGPAKAISGEADRPRPARIRHAPVPLSVPHEIPNWLFPNIDVTNSDVAQTEPMVAISPADSLNIIIGANDDRDSRQLWAYSSRDGGISWSDTDMPIPMESWILNATATDPSIAFTRTNVPLFVNGHLADAGSGNDVSCFTSTDEGIAWNLLSEVFQDSEGFTGVISDKYFVGVDNDASSPYYGRVYGTWVEIENSSARIVEAYSTDNGKSWSGRHYLSESGTYTSPVPVTEPDGTLLISFVDYFQNNQILVARSTDGGNTFTSPQVIATYRNIAPLYPPDNRGYENIGPPDSALGVNSFPAIAVDHTPAHNGRAYIVWCGKGNDSLPHIWLAMSDNDGVSWSAAQPVDGDSTRKASARFFPWVAVDPTTGNIGIDYYAALMDTVPPKVTGVNVILLANLYMLHSTDGGVSFACRRISNATFDPISGQDYRFPESNEVWFFGDYIGIAGRSNTWYPAWTDARTGDDEIYTSIVQPFAPMPVTNLARRDTMMNGKKASLLSWDYTPETTFGYPLAGGYQFDIAKDGATLGITGGDSLFFVDTNAEAGKEYEVAVLSGRYRSITDSIPNGNSSVASAIGPVSFYFGTSPAEVGHEDVLSIQCPAACKVTLMFFDELGRPLGPALTDESFSAQHTISFIPENAGVRFFVIHEMAAGASREIFGKILVQ